MTHKPQNSPKVSAIDADGAAGLSPGQNAAPTGQGRKPETNHYTDFWGEPNDELYAAIWGQDPPEAENSLEGNPETLTDPSGDAPQTNCSAVRNEIRAISRVTPGHFWYPALKTPHSASGFLANLSQLHLRAVEASHTDPRHWLIALAIAGVLARHGVDAWKGGQR